MKCLWRIIKLMPNWGEEIDYDLVLLELHNFLKEFPSIWWKNKPVDTPLRTIKTIIHSSVKIKGATIMCHFGKIPNPSESEIEAYILKLMKVKYFFFCEKNSTELCFLEYETRNGAASSCANTASSYLIFTGYAYNVD